MGLYSEAVALSLTIRKIERAKIYAVKPESDESKKKLWM